MDISFATAPGPGRPNEDLVIAADNFVIMLDGVTSPAHVPTGCVHNPVWLVRTLGAALTTGLSDDPAAPLDDVLADAITAVRNAHSGTCDLSHPESPSSTVAMVRETPGSLDYLVLCDSTVVLTAPDGAVTEVLTDSRTAGMRGLTRAEVARWRNAPGGFWVASTDPGAAAEALTGSIPRGAVATALVCTDGVSRLVEHFGWTWPQVLELAAQGPLRNVLRAVRAEETAGPPPGSTKQHDDATVARCDLASGGFGLAGG